jgi:hypothetical protein
MNRKNLLLFSLFFIFISCFTNNKENIKITTKKNINTDSLLNCGYSNRILKKLKIVVETEENKGKNFFIVDTKENLIFFFNKNGEFIAKSPTIDGAEKQINSGLKRKLASSSFEETVKFMGFKHEKNKFIDTTSKNRIYSHSLFYSHLITNKLRFFPSGTYKVNRIISDKNFLGGNNNTFCIVDSTNKELSLAIHGLYKSEYRIKIFNDLNRLIESPTDSPYVPKKYIQQVIKNIDNTYYNNSFGCINVSNDFIKKTKDLAKESFVYVLEE